MVGDNAEQFELLIDAKYLIVWKEKGRKQWKMFQCNSITEYQTVTSYAGSVPLEEMPEHPGLFICITE